jgi:hypothetical protein
MMKRFLNILDLILMLWMTQRIFFHRILLMKVVWLLVTQLIVQFLI